MSQQILDSHQLSSSGRRLVAKIGLSVSVLSSVVLLLTLSLITNEAGESYGAQIYSYVLTSRQIAPAMTIAGLVLVIVAGLIAWVTALFSSFRVAGPLYRLGQNLLLASENADRRKILPVREGDLLQAQSQSVQQAVDTVYDHNVMMEQAAHEASDAMRAGDERRYLQAVTRLRSLREKVRI